MAGVGLGALRARPGAGQLPIRPAAADAGGIPSRRVRTLPRKALRRAGAG